MATLGGPLFLEKVNRMVSRNNGKPVLKPNRALVLRDNVANRKLHKGEAPCITEMSVLMACWKANNFVDGLCSKEINTFYTCVRTAQADMKKNKSQENSSQGRRLHPKLATTLLKRYPNILTEI